MPSFLDCPILKREFRGRFRRGRAWVSLALVVAFVGWICWSALNVRDWRHPAPTNWNDMARLSDNLLFQLVWVQTLILALLSPSEAAPLIARERETGANEELLLSPMSPRRVALEKALAGAGFVGLMWLALLPLDLAVLLLGHRSPLEFWPVALLGLGTLAWGAMMGTAVSAHSRRASNATRGANGATILWLGASLASAIYAGESPFFFPLPPGSKAPFYTTWFGRTNPVLAALDLLKPSPLGPKWPFCAVFLVGGIAFFWWIASLGLQKPLAELPILSPRPRENGKVSGVSGALSRLEMPLVGGFAPQNPVLGREVRGKFRLRQPPLPILISEIVLGILVGGVYLLLVREAIVDPPVRETIFWGVAWAGFSVAILGAIASGAGALPREREGGTWESLRLSLLSPAQIVRGKLFAALATSIVLSLPAWPLLLLCVNWSGSWTFTPYPSGIAPFQLVHGVEIWLGTLWLQSIAAMLVGVSARKAGAATGVATLISLGWMFGSLFLMAWSDHTMRSFLGLTNPIMALELVMENSRQSAVGWPFVFFALIVGALLLRLVEREVGAAMRIERHSPTS